MAMTMAMLMFTDQDDNLENDLLDLLLLDPSPKCITNDPDCWLCAGHQTLWWRWLQWLVIFIRAMEIWRRPRCQKHQQRGTFLQLQCEVDNEKHLWLFNIHIFQNSFTTIQPGRWWRRWQAFRLWREKILKVLIF